VRRTAHISNDGRTGAAATATVVSTASRDVVVAALAHAEALRPSKATGAPDGPVDPQLADAMWGAPQVGDGIAAVHHRVDDLPTGDGDVAELPRAQPGGKLDRALRERHERVDAHRASAGVAGDDRAVGAETVREA